MRLTYPRMSARRQLRRAIPQPVRQRLYDWSPSRKRRWREVPGLENAPAAASVVLTFDDGPDPSCTPQVLEALNQAGAKATFFVLGRHVAEDPGLAREMLAEGHELALHGMTHRHHDQLSLEEAEAELRDGSEAIESAIGQRPTWYRPPFGSASPELADLCVKHGLGLAYWSAWGQDWEDSSAARIAGLVRRDLSPGTIVLLHDSARYGQRDDAEATVGSIPLIAAAARKEGLELVSLSTAVSDHAA
ncbi:MAG: polysaccharide deacetylase family protein [Thermoleophilia bacterium]|nr:polysaccharide deacetylase family protein [Thermoleophilia bacterium]